MFYSQEVNGGIILPGPLQDAERRVLIGHHFSNRVGLCGDRDIFAKVLDRLPDPCGARL